MAGLPQPTTYLHPPSLWEASLDIGSDSDLPSLSLPMRVRLKISRSHGALTGSHVPMLFALKWNVSIVY